MTARRCRPPWTAEPDLIDVAAVVAPPARRTPASSTTSPGSARSPGSGWWFHVDGAYGGAGIFAPSLRAQVRRMELADSFILDPHKWLFTPFDCCALLYRNPELARATHTQDASYLDVIHTSSTHGTASGTPPITPTTSPGAPADSRSGSRWRCTGSTPTGRRSRSRSSLAQQTAELIKADPNLELIREPDLGVVLFRRIGWEPADYDKWAQALHEEQIAFIPPTKWDGETVGRFAFLHPHTSMDLVREILERTG